MHARSSVLAAAVILAMLPAAAMAQDATTPAEPPTEQQTEQQTEKQTEKQLEQSKSELDAAGRSLADVEAELDRTRRAVDEVDAKLNAASAELDRVGGELAAAQAAFEAAQGRERAAAVEVMQADQVIQDRVSAWDDNKADLQARASDLYKHGPAATSDILMHGVLSAEDMHEVSVTYRTVQALIERDRELLAGAKESALVAADARGESIALRTAAKSEQRAASIAKAKVEQLQAQQQRVVADIATEQATRQSVLDRVAADRSQSAVLVAQLQERVERLTEKIALTLLVEPEIVPFDGPMPSWGPSLPGNGPKWAPAIAAAGARAGIDGRLLAAVAWTESNFTQAAVSHAGALGLVQLMPATAAGLGVNPRDPLDNLVGGARYLRYQLDRFGRIDLALAAYNAGPGRVINAGYAVPNITETQLYVVRVMERYERIMGS